MPKPYKQSTNTESVQNSSKKEQNNGQKRSKHNSTQDITKDSIVQLLPTPPTTSQNQQKQVSKSSTTVQSQFNQPSINNSNSKRKTPPTHSNNDSDSDSTQNFHKSHNKTSKIYQPTPLQSKLTRDSNYNQNNKLAQKVTTSQSKVFLHKDNEDTVEDDTEGDGEGDGEDDDEDDEDDDEDCDILFDGEGECELSSLYLGEGEEEFSADEDVDDDEVDKIVQMIKNSQKSSNSSNDASTSDDDDLMSDGDDQDLLDSNSIQGFEGEGFEGEGYEGEIEFDEEFLLSLINGTDSEEDDDDNDSDDSDDDYSASSRSNTNQSDLSGLSFKDIMKTIESDVKLGKFQMNDSSNDSDTSDTSEDDNDITTTTTPTPTPNNEEMTEKQRREQKDFAKMSSPFSVQVTRTPEIHTSRLQLPVCAQEHEIMELIHSNDIVILSGETGSGKTTQVPQFLYESGYCRDGVVGITQPRRVAAISASNRVKMELNLLDTTVGFQIRFENNCTAQTRIKMMTEGVLLREIQNDFLLSRYSCIIIDEAHERGLNTDILLGLLSRIIPLRNKIVEICKQLQQVGLLSRDDSHIITPNNYSSDQDEDNKSFYKSLSSENQRFFDAMLDSIVGTPLQPKVDQNASIAQVNTVLGLDDSNTIMGFDLKKLKFLPFHRLAQQFALHGVSKGKLKLIIMSATLRVTDFTQNYKLFPLPPPVYTVSSRQYPVSTHFSRLTPSDYVDKAIQKVCRIHTRLPNGAILVFLTGREEIEAFCTKLRDIFPAPNPDEDNSVNFHNSGLGVGRLYLKATKMVKKALFDYNIAVDFTEEDKLKAAQDKNDKNNKNKKHQPIGKGAGMVIADASTTFAKATTSTEGLISKTQQRWGLLKWDDDDDVVANKLAAEKKAKEKLTKVAATHNEQGQLLGPQGTPSSDTITPKALKFLIQKQVVLLKEGQEKKRLSLKEGRDTKDTKKSVFSLEDIANAENEERRDALSFQEYQEQHKNDKKAKKEAKKNKNNNNIADVTPSICIPISENIQNPTPNEGNEIDLQIVNVITELVKYRVTLAKRAQKKSQKASGTKSAVENSHGNDEKQISNDSLDDDFDEDNELLYDLSDDDDYDDDDAEGSGKDRKSDEMNSDGEDDVKTSGFGGSGNDEENLEDASLNILEKEQKQSPASKQKQQQRWEEELEQLKTNSPIPLLVLPLYAMLPTVDQMKVFQWEKYSHGARVVIVSTNMAETSVTIPNIKYVIDTGREKVKNVDLQTGATDFKIGFIPQSSAGQRAGRAGRTGPGHAYRLYSGAVFTDFFPLHSTPEILKQPFENTLLQMKSIGIHDITRFPFPTPPLYKTVKSSGYLLYVLGALQTKQEKLHKLRQTEALALLKDNKSHLNASLQQSMGNNLLNQHNFAQQNRAQDSAGNAFELKTMTKWERLQQQQRLQTLNEEKNKNSTKTLSFELMTAGMTRYQKKQYAKQRQEEDEQKAQFEQQKALVDDAIQSIEQVRIPTAGGTQYSTLVDMDITTLGETMAFFPLHPRFSKIILTCANQPLGVLTYGIALSAVMTIQEIHITPRFVQEYEIAAKKAKQNKKNKNKGGQNTTKGGIKDLDSDDDDNLNVEELADFDLTNMDSDDEDEEIAKINKSLADIDEKQQAMVKFKRNIGRDINDELSELMATKEKRKYEKLLQLKLQKIADKKAHKEWLQEQYQNYRTKVGQFTVPNSDLFTKLNIFGAYLFTRLSFIKQSWLLYKKDLYQQYQNELKSQKITQQFFEEQCFKNNIPIPQLAKLSPNTIASQFGHLIKTPQTYQTLPSKLRIQIDKQLEQWCRGNFIRPKGLADCYKLFQQIIRIVATHLRSKIQQLERTSDQSIGKTKNGTRDTEADDDVNLEDITLGDQDDEEHDKNAPDSSVLSNANTIDSKSKVNVKTKQTELTPIAAAKIARMKLLLDNLSLFNESMPPPDQDMHSLLQQIILASFADKLAWKMTDERKEEYIQRHKLQRSNPSHPSALVSDKIKLIPRPKHYNEQIRNKLTMLKQRFGLITNQVKTIKLDVLTTGASDTSKHAQVEVKKELPPEYLKQREEFVSTIPLAMDDLMNAYEILDSDEPVFISPQSVLYKKQGSWMTKMNQARHQGKSDEIIIDSNNTQALQQLAAQRKLKSSTLNSLQSDMDNELRFLVFNELVENQGQYSLTFINDCTLLSESWLPTICDQLCHINKYSTSPQPYLNNPLCEKLSSKQSSKSTPDVSSQLMRYADITYGHKRWALQPYPVPYLPTVISTLQSSMGNNALKFEQLTEGTGTIQQYFQWLAKFILDGTIFPSVKSFVQTYSHSPSLCLEDTKLRDPALSFVACLTHHQIYTIQDLYNMWWYTTPIKTNSNMNDDNSDSESNTPTLSIRPKNPKFLLQEFNMFITNKQDRIQFANLWPPKPPNSQQ